MTPIYVFADPISIVRMWLMLCNSWWTTGKVYFTQREVLWYQLSASGTTSIFSGQVAIQNDENQRVHIPRLSTSEARQTLSVRIAPDGNWDTEVEYLTSIAADWKVRMAAA